MCVRGADASTKNCRMRTPGSTQERGVHILWRVCVRAGRREEARRFPFNIRFFGGRNPAPVMPTPGVGGRDGDGLVCRGACACMCGRGEGERRGREEARRSPFPSTSVSSEARNPASATQPPFSVRSSLPASPPSGKTLLFASSSICYVTFSAAALSLSRYSKHMHFAPPSRLIVTNYLETPIDVHG